MKQTRGSRQSTVPSPKGAALLAPRQEAEVCCNLGRDSLLSGDLEEALWYLRQAVETDGGCSIAWQLLGRCFEEMGESLRARRCYSLAFRLYLKSSPSGVGGPQERLPIIWPPRERQDS